MLIMVNTIGVDEKRRLQMVGESWPSQFLLSLGRILPICLPPNLKGFRVDDSFPGEAILKTMNGNELDPDTQLDCSRPLQSRRGPLIDVRPLATPGTRPLVNFSKGHRLSVLFKNWPTDAAYRGSLPHYPDTVRR